MAEDYEGRLQQQVGTRLETKVDWRGVSDKVLLLPPLVFPHEPCPNFLKSFRTPSTFSIRFTQASNYEERIAKVQNGVPRAGAEVERLQLHINEIGET